MTYDYIIIGAGSTGAPLAARLTENPVIRVLLLEAGPDLRTNDVQLGMACPNPLLVLTRPEFQRYQYHQMRARRTPVQQPLLYWRGRGVGGSSIINGQIAIRPMLEDFDVWSGQGCAGWSGQDVLPYFIKLENDLDFGDQPYHGRNGPIPIWRMPQDTWAPMSCGVRDAALALGYGWSDDHNAPGSTGVSPYAINSWAGRRVSTNDAYLEPARDRANLTILADALVERVIFDGTRATGVQIRRKDGPETFLAGEIILSAGVIHSPAILMRSGVGPADHLRSLDIPVVLDQPAVGQNLVDHSAVPLWVHLRPTARVGTVEFRHTQVCVRFSSGLAGGGENDMIMIVMNLRGADDDARALGRLTVSVYETRSRGWLRLTSADPAVDPEIELNMLADDGDLVRLRDGARRIFEIARHPALTAIAERISVDTAGHSITDVESTESLDRWLLENCVDTQHPVGTCRMGSPDDPRTVVDSECRVLGLAGLRVIDAAIMPEVPRANTHLACVMIGEYMADRIRRAHTTAPDRPAVTAS